ncbi:drug resistance transporter, EmrB/QacA subfamily [Acidithiobacillus ferrivorans SS3]|uniref:Drug resistance transporter, EmrB/QacA subfamily n=1 Tax=Acidithiobacillus ferrivorans SS3 TaxID=743299 RepID=G0JPF0_9PROT|nr:drug resistance transporter, EmrB/QacA subfamily [Acidithiobacillus ferrivorans SS3]MBU2765366.1 DHA2 family efflux MFS transporter permease subunit [Acidithiobacillus ferrivorans]MBU2849887.1 DHA2 family efflux MFS transporter permease subunit [Acidithiobacillus ferrivorans]OFA15519.1 multidrug MFS transporter [Acidithiobacillus ferrivorans]
MAQESPASRLTITVAVMLAVVMQVLDLTIVNVALTYMRGSLHANSDQITWVLTSYMVANVIILPLTGLLVERYGQRNIMLWSVVGFVISSVLCGQSHSLLEIVLWRFLQGIFGASLAPVGQTIMLGAYPSNKRGQAMAILGMGIMLGPILGPTLGGYLTDTLSWRWVFYVNIPFGILAFLLMQTIPDGGKSSTPRPVDWTGFALMALGLGSLQGVLSLGDQDNWFSSRTIIILTIGAVLGMLFFVWRSLSVKYPVVDLRLLKDRNLSIGSMGIGIFGLALFGTMVILPIMLETLMHYEAFTAGLVMAPQGIGAMLAMMLAGRLLGRGVNPRNIVLVGVIFGAVGTYFTTLYSLDISMAWLIWPSFIRGIGFGLVTIPLFTLAFSTLKKSQQAEGSGIFNLMRTLGGSIGIAIVSTVTSQETQVGWNQMGGFINPFNPAFHHYLAAAGMTQNPTTWQVLGNVVLYSQANMRGMLDAFVLVFYGFLVMIPLIIFLKKPPADSAPPTHLSE